MARPGTMVYFSILPALERLTDEQCGKLFRALLHYGENAEAPDFGADLVLPVLWPLIQQDVDRDSKRYSEKCEKTNYANICKTMRKAGQNPPSFDEWKAERNQTEPDGAEWNRVEPNYNSNSNINPNTNINSNVSANTTSIPSSAAAAPLTPAPFTPPSLQEVKNFVAQEGLPVNSERFYNYYESVGWRIGQNPMVDWRAACRRWSDKPRETEAAPAPPEIDGREQARRMEALHAVLSGERDT